MSFRALLLTVTDEWQVSGDRKQKTHLNKLGDCGEETSLEQPVVGSSTPYVLLLETA